jgi:negative regulator of sigma E activity
MYPKQGVTMRMQQFLITAAVALAVVLGVQHYQRTKA